MFSCLSYNPACISPHLSFSLQCISLYLSHHPLSLSYVSLILSNVHHSLPICQPTTRCLFFSFPKSRLLCLTNKHIFLSSSRPSQREYESHIFLPPQSDYPVSRPYSPHKIDSPKLGGSHKMTYILDDHQGNHSSWKEGKI